MSGLPPNLLLAGAALFVICVTAMRIEGIVRVILIAQTVYWSLSYIARPLALLWVSPQPRFGDSIADPRLASMGYFDGIENALRPVAFGLWCYAVLVVAYALWQRGRPPKRLQMLANPDFLRTSWAVYAIGLLGRAVVLATGSVGVAGEIESPNPILNFVAALAIVGSLGLILYYRSASDRSTALLIGLLALVELGWSIAAESKTPVLAVAVAIGVRFALTGWTRAKAALIICIAGLGIGGFSWLQSFKSSGEQEAIASLADSGYPAALRPFLGILRRFDLLEAATDAYYMNGRPWLSVTESAQHVLNSFIPAQLLNTEKFTAGVKWAQEVRGSSVDMRGISVALAEGNVNEGYVLGGYIGVAVGVTFTFVLMLLWISAIHSRYVIPAVMGLFVIEFPILFERGILGSAEVVGKYLQLAILVWLVYLLSSTLRGRSNENKKESGATGPEVEPISAVIGKD